MVVAARDGVPGADPSDRDDEDFAELRALLIGPERQQLDALQARLDDPITHAQDVGRVLPQALTARARDPDLARALTFSVEQAITTSVRRNPRPLAEALFPVMGPAIRKAVSASLAAMIDSLNRTMEHSVSWQSLKWRLTAIRTGKPFAEIVLLNTLLYRVEQIFLIDRRTGLLLRQVRAGTAPALDPDMISGMLTAIRDFVQDSFQVSKTDSLDALKVGDLSVWIEQGPRAILAAVIRGNAPPDLRQRLQQALETVHLQLGDALEAFDGDDSAFEAARPALEECLHTEYRERSRSRAHLLWLALGLGAIALVIWGSLGYREWSRWQRYLNVLQAETGIVVLSSGAKDGRYFVNFLRDPLAGDPKLLLSSAGLSTDDVILQSKDFQSLDRDLVEKRARSLLQPPPGVTLTLGEGVLRAEGDAPASWIADARRLAPFVAGVRQFDADRLIANGRRALEARVDGLNLLFVKARSELLPGQTARLDELRAALRELDVLAGTAGARIRVEVRGHADADGDEGENVPLSQLRAELVRQELQPASLAHVDLIAQGIGSQEPVAPGRTEADMQRNRRVVLRVAPAARGESSGEHRDR